MADLRKLGRRTDHRDSMLRNQVQSLLEKGRIETTLTRAKETRRVASVSHTFHELRAEIGRASCRERV